MLNRKVNTIIKFFKISFNVGLSVKIFPLTVLLYNRDIAKSFRMCKHYVKRHFRAENAAPRCENQSPKRRCAVAKPTDGCIISNQRCVESPRFPVYNDVTDIKGAVV